MDKTLTLYHGSSLIIERPQFGKGNPFNDYGLGFYCTETLELAKEWACSMEQDGFANRYSFQTDGLSILNLSDGKYNILNWLSILLMNRKFNLSSDIAVQGKEYLASTFLPPYENYDVIIGYRADDSYFSFAEDFVSNTISLRDLNMAMQLGTLGEQIVLLSKRSFGHIEFTGYEVADYREYYYKRFERDQKARADYARRKKTLQQLTEDIFILDIIREGMDNDDPRLRLQLSL